MLTAIATILIVLAGAGGVAYSADKAGPGDALFGIDQAVEKARISLAGEARKDELRIKFAEERLKEIDDIVKEDSDDDSEDDSSSDTSVSLSDDKKARAALGVELAAKTIADISVGISNEEAKARLEKVVADLNAKISSLPEDVRVEIRNDRIKISSEDDDSDSRIKIRMDGDELRIDYRDEDSDDDNISDGDDDSSNSGSSSDSNSGSGSSNSDRRSSDADDDDDENSSPGDATQFINNVLQGQGQTQATGQANLEIESDVFTDITTVEVELNDAKTNFTTSSKTRAAIIADILARFPSLTEAQVDAALELEIENRASRPQDLD